jgi:hypothetical protein
MKLIIFFLVLFNIAHADSVGRIVKHSGQKLLIHRGTEKLEVRAGAEIKLNDELETFGENALVHIYPGIQLSLSSKSKLLIQEHSIQNPNAKTQIVLAVMRLDAGAALVRIQPMRKESIMLRLETEGTSTAAESGEFEVTLIERNTDILVLKDQVSVSSPHVQSFVPEIVKSGNGLRFLDGQKIFSKVDLESRKKSFLPFVKKSQLLKFLKRSSK